ncbi:MAG: phosphate/phosphite/phosphonate ABC transporter substrate-binding protein [Trichodesmium sp. St16_bin2-tuft]|jgi:phosphonate transport system substrate-binding protein|nr:phosphate/phosphite/phosphonate ABC transporter substrate-binding protein [Trichodesmium sp. MAG_R02]MDE5086109.1 phosphate/phosphite/phosphonate ABC transporter substrate-binding protein [Trichodesmium sp. St16_bin2-tuft]MDE5111320.1 phosphate/phosphite/phosphonate ABC transporter substrate-binding protein [Trichodesmium sp. St7_bin2_1]
MKFTLWPNNLFFRYSLFFSLLLSISTTTVSCAGPELSEKNSESLRVAVLPWQSSKGQQEKLQPLAKYLGTHLKHPVNFQITKNYAEAVDLIVKEEVDMAYLAALTYIKARERNPNIKPLVIPINRISGRPWYTSVIIADTTKNIKTIEDLKGKRFAFVSPSSTSGFLIPMNGLQTAGIDPTRDFSKIRYSGSHDQATQDLVDGVVDAVTNDKASFLRSQKSGKLDANYKIIWESGPIPAPPIVINTKKFTPKIIDQLQEILIDAPIGVVDVSGTESAGYTLGKDADFEEIRQIYTRLKYTKVAEK